jgi:uridine kinase
MICADIVEQILTKQRALPERRSLLVAISGIDGSGKSTIAPRIVEGVNRRGVKAVLIGLDAWHTPPEERFNPADPARHFYRHAFRFEELFSLLIDPLQRNRSIDLTVELTRLPENDRFPHSYSWRDVDVIVLEGIFLLKRELRDRCDLALWIECSFETALRRALRRNQEGLSESEIIRDYHTIYFAAQEIHFAEDDPRSSADGILENEDRLKREVPHGE